MNRERELQRETRAEARSGKDQKKLPAAAAAATEAGASAVTPST
jgi:hypothetical protein